MVKAQWASASRSTPAAPSPMWWSRTARHTLHRQGADDAATHLRRHARRDRCCSGGVRPRRRRALATDRHADLRHHAGHQCGRDARPPPRRRSSPPAASAIFSCSRRAANTTRTTTRTTIRRPISRAATRSRSTSASTRRAMSSVRSTERQARDVIAHAQRAQVRGRRRQPDVVDRQRRARAGDRAHPRRGAARRSLHALARADPDRARISPRLHHGGRCFAQAADAGALRQMEEDLRAGGFTGELLIGTSAGGCQHVSEVATRPVQMLKSGPAMAPVAGQAYTTIEKSRRRRDRVRHRRHDLRRWPGARRQSRLHARQLARTPLDRPHGRDVDGRRAQHRRRRRLDRLGRRRRAAARRPAERRRGARARLLRPRRRASRP